ncbi:AAA family ATPase [Bacillus cereus]|uniref:AAA family ATPase n=1 Tax=Bacillus cereus TaxID=1396 RepID=UPI0006A8131A|nr:AAA family ATPase [Bacillus cereus]MDA1817643.1 AAA family ATPase [Bacillus cereus]CUB29339.1 5-methylcytosine-specific restriction enzyme B [Bacillus cereus]
MSTINNVLLIKINQLYKNGMTPEELYYVTSVSGGVNLTETENIKYYCSVVKNKIIEVYGLLGLQQDLTTDNNKKGHYILEGELADQELREKLIGLNVQDLLKGSGNSIKHESLDILLAKTETSLNQKLQTASMIYSTLPEELIEHIYQYIKSKGFIYSIQSITNLYLSLRSKPFVIISGISGTGKTKIVQLFAESIGAKEDNGQFKLIPVRPDWSDSSDLIGYVDIKGDFKKGPFTEIVERAHKNSNRPYFVLLDEMNLARVEYYFSDVLSVLESRKKENGEFTSSPLVQNEHVSITLPGNLYIIGTVNMDETTHSFSKKVLDRANTIEFNEINLTNFDFIDDSQPIEATSLTNELLEASYIHLIDVFASHTPLIKKVSGQLSEINAKLQSINAQVGYRVRDEICFYMIYNEKLDLLTEKEALDFCVMQKILPRISGSGDRVQQLLEDLYEHFTEEKYVLNQQVFEDIRYPRSAKKVVEMLRRLSEDGFTSFWIA